MTVESLLSVEFIYCGCGCQKTRPKYDSRGRECKYIFGHIHARPKLNYCEFVYCKCGCGKTCPKYSKHRPNQIAQYIHGHNTPKSDKDRNELIVCECGCGETRSKYDQHLVERKYIVGHNQRGKTPWNFIGRQEIQYGYIIIYCPEHPYSTSKGYVMEHRLVMESHLGRYLKPEEKIHHNDKNPSNNNLSNLVLVDSQSNHIKLYHGRDPEIWKRICYYCKTNKVYIDKLGRLGWRKTNLPNRYMCNRCYDKIRRKRMCVLSY